MKKYYKYGEMLLALREEYKSCKYLLDKLNDYIKIEDENVNSYFSGFLSDDRPTPAYDKGVRLTVEKKYLDILKKIQYLKYNWYAQYLYRAFFDVEKQANGLYRFNYSDMLTPVDGKKYIPRIEIIDQKEFSNLIDELLSTDLMQSKRGYFSNDQHNISLNLDNGYISTPLGNGSMIFWGGIRDYFEYSINTRYHNPVLIEEIFSLEMPVDKISPDWLKILEKHENDFDEELSFDVDPKMRPRNGILYISDIEDNKTVKMLRKVK